MRDRRAVVTKLGGELEKLRVNDKITASSNTNISTKHYIKPYRTSGVINQNSKK